MWLVLPLHPLHLSFLQLLEDVGLILFWFALLVLVVRTIIGKD